MQTSRGLRRTDFGGFADVVACARREGRLIAIQSTSGSHHANRVNKITRRLSGESLKKYLDRTDNALSWLESGGEIVVWSWAGEAPLLKFRETWIVPADFAVNKSEE